jgi:hypothetical protein
MDWQQLGAILIVAAAFLWLVRRALRSRGGSAACGGCVRCAATSSPERQSPSLIRIDDPAPSLSRRAGKTGASDRVEERPARSSGAGQNPEGK